MRVYLMSLLLIVVAAEASSLVWLHRESQPFRGLVGKRGVPAEDLTGKRSADLLSFDEGVSYSSQRGAKVEVIVLGWNEGNSHGLMDAFGHSPEVCLPLSGARLLETLPTETLVIGEENFQVECWKFSHPLSQEYLYAYKLSHSSAPEVASLAREGKLVESRLQLFRERAPMPAIEIAIGVVQDVSDPELAWDSFALFARDNLEIQSSPL